MELSFSKLFPQSGTSPMDRLRSMALCTFRATSLRNQLDDLDAQMREVSDKLLHLTTGLSSALKIEDKLETLTLVEIAIDMFRAGASAPALTDTFELDFDSKDASGNPMTPDGILKLAVLSIDSSSTVTLATRVMKSVCCIVGMAGVGKTVALVGLAHDRDVRIRFPDGVFFITLGQGATAQW